MITLNQNIFVGTITNLIAYSIYHDNYRVGDDVDRLLEVFRSDDVPMGDGKVVHTSDLPEVVDLNPNTSSLLTITKPTLQEQYIPVSEYKKVPLSINDYLLRGAFVDEGALGLLASYLLNTMQIAKKLHMYKRIHDVLNNIESAGDYTTVTLTGVAVSASSTPLEKNAAYTYNTNLLYREIIKQIKAVGKGVTIKISGGDDSGEDFKVYERPDNIVVLLSDALMASLDVDTLATLLNSSEITRNVPVEFITIDYSLIPNGTINCLYVLSKDKIQYGFFYQVATQFFDASNLNTQNWLHFSDYCASVHRAYLIGINLENFVG